MSVSHWSLVFCFRVGVWHGRPGRRHHSWEVEGEDPFLPAVLEGGDIFFFEDFLEGGVASGVGVVVFDEGFVVVVEEVVFLEVVEEVAGLALLF